MSKLTPCAASIILKAAAFMMERTNGCDSTLYMALMMASDSLEKQYDLTDIISAERIEE